MTKFLRSFQNLPISFSMQQRGELENCINQRRHRTHSRYTSLTIRKTNLIDPRNFEEQRSRSE